jgi:hypothetical protein
VKQSSSSPKIPSSQHIDGDGDGDGGGGGGDGG